MKKGWLLLAAGLMIILAGCSKYDKSHYHINNRIPVKELAISIEMKLKELHELHYKDAEAVDPENVNPYYQVWDIKEPDLEDRFAPITDFNIEKIVTGFVIQPTLANQDSELILVLEVKNDEAGQDLEKSMKKLKAYQDYVWEDYIPRQHEFVKGNKIEKQGNFLLYATSQYAEEVVKLFQFKVQ